jgi:CheY-like chemotaxis protein
MSHNILIVEDNENNRSLLEDILSLLGYEITVATDGQEGVALARRLMPDLILMDIQMPFMDGLTAGRILKGDPATSGLKIIALTSFAIPGDQEKFMAAGFDGYLSNPINTRELPGQIKQWLEGEECSTKHLTLINRISALTKLSSASPNKRDKYVHEIISA